MGSLTMARDNEVTSAVQPELNYTPEPTFYEDDLLSTLEDYFKTFSLLQSQKMYKLFI
jgi:hypothetical protein